MVLILDIINFRGGKEEEGNNDEIKSMTI